MAGAFPTLSDGQRVKAGYVHSIQIRAYVTRYRSGKEQRNACSGVLNSFRLSYSGINWNDLTAIRDFFVTQKGAFDQTWTIDLLDPSTRLVRTYAGMAFASDEFSYTETSIGRYSVTLEITQTVAEGIGSHSPQTIYPTINNNVRVQLPFVTSLAFRTDRNDLDSGKRVTYPAWTAPLRSWKLEYPAVDDNETKVLTDFYYDQGGPVNPFSFTDPNTGAVHSSCRYSDSPLQITRTGVDLNKVTLGIEEFKV